MYTFVSFAEMLRTFVDLQLRLECLMPSFNAIDSNQNNCLVLYYYGVALPFKELESRYLIFLLNWVDIVLVVLEKETFKSRLKVVIFHYFPHAKQHGPPFANF